MSCLSSAMDTMLRLCLFSNGAEAALLMLTRVRHIDGPSCILHWNDMIMKTKVVSRILGPLAGMSDPVKRCSLESCFM